MTRLNIIKGTGFLHAESEDAKDTKPNLLVEVRQLLNYGVNCIKIYHLTWWSFRDSMYNEMHRTKMYF